MTEARGLQKVALLRLLFSGVSDDVPADVLTKSGHTKNKPARPRRNGNANGTQNRASVEQIGYRSEAGGTMHTVR